MREIGIDEAGRGPVLGPLVMAAVALSPQQTEQVLRLGVQDSKKYGSNKKGKDARYQAYLSLVDLCDYRVMEIAPSTIDSYVERGALDDLERQGALQLLKDLGASKEDHIICDGAPIFSRLSHVWPNLRAENKADTKYLSVSAASIIAKTRRDQIMEDIFKRYQKEFGEIKGGGYVNKNTREFLLAYEDKYGKLPDEARKSWTWRPSSQPKWPDIVSLLQE